MTKEELIEALHDARDRLDAVLAGIEPQDEIYAGWTIKHLLAHLAGWDDAVIAALRAHMGGHELGTPATEGIDVYNARSVETREPLNLAQVRRESELSRRQLIDLLTAMPDEQYETPLIFPWGPRGSVEGLVRVFIHHEQVHAAEIQALIEQGTITREKS